MSCGCVRTESEGSDGRDESSSLEDSEAEPEPGLFGLQPERIGHVENRRGDRLAFWSWAPVGRERGVAVLFHGYATSSRFPTVVWLAEVLVRAGIRCYSADMVGHGLSEGLPGLLPGVQQLAEDGLDVVNEVRSRHPGSKVLLCGTSMGGAIALLVGLLADFELGGAVLISPMLRQAAVNMPNPAVVAVLRGLSYVVPSLAVIKTNATQAELQYTDPARREQCEQAAQYSGLLRLGSAATLVGCTEHLQQRFEDVRFPLFIAMGGKEVIVDPTAAQELLDRASTPREQKVLRTYPAGQHGLLAEAQPLRQEIESDIARWVASRLAA